MNSPNITTAACNLPQETNQPGCVQGPGALCPGGDSPPCSGPTTPGASCISLAVVPPDGFCEVGASWPFRAVATFSDNSCADVTDQCIWESSSEEVATISAVGVATAVGSGIATISAEFGTCFCFAALQVELPCHAIGQDVVLVLPRDSGMLLSDSGQSRIAAVALGASQLVASMGPADQTAVVSYAGLVFAGGANTQGDATIDCGLTNSQSSLESAIAGYGVRGPCYFPDPVAGPNTRCAIGIGAALHAAYGIITGPSHTPGSRQLVVLVVDGRDRVGTPDPAAVAAQITGAGATLAIFALDVSADYGATLASYASPGYYRAFAVPSDCSAAIAAAAYMQCAATYPYTYGDVYTNPYVSGPTPPNSPNPPPTNPSDPGNVALNLSGLRVNLPITGPALLDNLVPSQYAPCVAKDLRLTTIGGVSGQIYNVTLRIRGAAELFPNVLVGSSPNGHFVLGSPVSTTDVRDGVSFALKVSPPTGSGTVVYFLNYAPFLSIFAGNPPVLLDYTVTVPMQGQSTVFLLAESLYGRERINSVVVPGLPPAPSAFNGQFVQIDVVSVA